MNEENMFLDEQQDELIVDESLQKELWKVPVSIELIRDSNISDGAFRFFLNLCYYARTKKTAFPSINRLCEDLQISESTVNRYKNELRDAGVLDWLKEKKESSSGYKYPHNIYTLLAYEPIKGKSQKWSKLPFKSDLNQGSNLTGTTIQKRTTNNTKVKNTKVSTSTYSEFAKKLREEDSDEDIPIVDETPNIDAVSEAVQDSAIVYLKKHPDISQDTLEIAALYYIGVGIEKDISDNDIKYIEENKDKFKEVKSHLDKDPNRVWNECSDAVVASIDPNKRYIGGFVQHGLLDVLVEIVKQKKEKEYRDNDTLNNKLKVTQAQRDEYNKQLWELLKAHPEEIKKIAKRNNWKLRVNWKELFEADMWDLMFDPVVPMSYFRPELERVYGEYTKAI